MKIYLYACAVHGLPDVSETDINDFFQLSFIDGRYMLKDSFSFSLYFDLNACFIDFGLLNHSTFLTEDY